MILIGESLGIAGMIKKMSGFYRNKPDKFIYLYQNKLG